MWAGLFALEASHWQHHLTWVVWSLRLTYKLCHMYYNWQVCVSLNVSLMWFCISCHRGQSEWLSGANMPTNWLSLWARASARSPACSGATSPSICNKQFAWLVLFFSSFIYVVFAVQVEDRSVALHATRWQLWVTISFVPPLLQLDVPSSWLLAGYVTPKAAVHFVLMQQSLY